MECSRRCRPPGSKLFLIPNWPEALTALQLGDTSLPAEQPEMLDDDLLKALHHVLLEVRKFPVCSLPSLTGLHKIHIEEGQMTCPNCNHAYPISNGIPNMVCRLMSTYDQSLTPPSSSQNTRSRSNVLCSIYVYDVDTGCPGLNNSSLRMSCHSSEVFKRVVSGTVVTWVVPATHCISVRRHLQEHSIGCLESGL